MSAYINLATSPAYQSHHQPVAKGNAPSAQESYLSRQIGLRIHYALQRTIQLQLQLVGQHETGKPYQTPYATFHQTQVQTLFQSHNEILYCFHFENIP